MPSSSLTTYRAKRDFAKTDEPSGSSAAVSSARPRFVVQKHAARRLHYDLRLELDGVFKSWAVTKGPSLDPSDKRLAVEVEDHPLDYGDFEGTIPQGQYGGGTVQLWDRGYWQFAGTGSPEAALRKGELKFVLDGKRLKGGFVLVRMRKDGSRNARNNWLLIKHHDEYERQGNAVLEEDRSVASGRSMAEIAAGKGRVPTPFIGGGRAEARPDAQWHSNISGNGGGDKPADASEKVRASRSKPETRPSTPKKPAGKKIKTMPSFVAPQLCLLRERPPTGPGWAHEIKFDGYRVQVRVEDGQAVSRTRKGLDWSEKFSAIAEAARGLPDCILDGEIVALDENGAPDFAALQAALSEGNTDDLIYFAFDLLFVEGEDLRDAPLADRKVRLKEMLKARAKAAPRLRYVEHFETGGDAVLRSACRMSLEGIVSKRLDAAYTSGRHETWTKSKCRAGHEVVIGGWSETDGQFRSLLVGAHRSGHLVYLGRVGTGFGRATVASIFPLIKAQESDRSPFGGANTPRRERGVHWIKPVLVAEIEFAGWTADGMVRQAAFKALREDKPAEEVEAEKSGIPGIDPARTAAAPSGKRFGSFQRRFRRGRRCVG